MKNETVDESTGLISEGKLNQIIHVITKRKDGTLRIQTDYQNCPTMTEQHAAHETDINYLIKRYQPDELAAYIASRNVNRRELVGHDFSIEPNLQDARNMTYILKKSFEELPDSVKNHFSNHVEFLKFIDNPANQEKMIKLGLLTRKQITQNLPPTNEQTQTNETPPAETKPKTKTKTEAP